MSSEEQEPRSASFYQGDFFSALVQDLKLKAIHRFSTHNLFSLSKKPRQEPIRHQISDGASKLSITVRNDSGSGIATVFDQDLLLFLISALVREQDSTGHISNRPTFAPADFFHFKGIKRSGGKDHKQLYESIIRLQNTFVEFSGDANLRRKISFNWISYIDAVSNKEKTKVLRYTVEVPSAIVNAIASKQFLTLDHSYFSISSPLSRFLYLFARKAVGRKRSWTESIASLYSKSGSKDSFRKFKFQLKQHEGKTLGQDPWGYSLTVSGDSVTFFGRDQLRDNNKQKLLAQIGSLVATKTVRRM